jgi:hypothetical protein
VIFVVIGAGPALEVHGQDLLVELGGPLCQLVRIAVGALLGQLEGGLDVRRLLGDAVVQGAVRVDPGEGFLDFLQELVGRRPISDDPVDLLPVLVDEELGRRRPDVEPFIGGVPVFFAPDGAIEDDALVEEIGVFGIVVELLNQQFTAPSATRVEIDENELVLFLGLGQRLVEGSREDRRRLCGGERSDEEEAGERGEFLHAALLDRFSVSISIQHPAARRNPRDHSSIRPGRAKGCVSLDYSRIETALRCEARGVKLYSSVLRTPRTKQMGPDRFARRVKTLKKNGEKNRAFL